MTNELCILILAFAYVLLFAWAFQALPREQWQILAALPREKSENGAWVGLNLTYYGLWTATAVMLAVMVLMILMGAIAVPLWGVSVLAALLLMVCVPAAKILAQLIEHKTNTFTVGGSVFTGLLLAPWLVMLVNQTVGRWMGFHMPVVATLAALTIAYALGEGTGRLACISFGCCYGNPLSTSHPLLSTLFATHHFSFTGHTKKISYESGMESMPVIPIQAITAVLCVGSGLVGLALFLQGSVLAAFLETVLVTQVWRAVSEVMRADCRGEGRFSAYQLMALFIGLYCVIVSLIVPPEYTAPADILAGLASLWNPAPILFLQAVWLVLFLITGRSKVTASTISLHVVKDRI